MKGCRKVSWGSSPYNTGDFLHESSLKGNNLASLVMSAAGNAVSVTFSFIWGFFIVVKGWKDRKDYWDQIIPARWHQDVF